MITKYLIFLLLFCYASRISAQNWTGIGLGIDTFYVSAYYCLFCNSSIICGTGIYMGTPDKQSITD